MLSRHMNAYSVGCWCDLLPCPGLQTEVLLLLVTGGSRSLTDRPPGRLFWSLIWLGIFDGSRQLAPDCHGVLSGCEDVVSNW